MGCRHGNGDHDASIPQVSSSVKLTHEGRSHVPRGAPAQEQRGWGRLRGEAWTPCHPQQSLPSPLMFCDALCSAQDGPRGEESAGTEIRKDSWAHTVPEVKAQRGWAAFETSFHGVECFILQTLLSTFCPPPAPAPAPSLGR